MLRFLLPYFIFAASLTVARGELGLELVPSTLEPGISIPMGMSVKVDEDFAKYCPGFSKIICYGEQGRVYVAEMKGKSSLVRCLVDSDGDGIFDESAVFAEGFKEIAEGEIGGMQVYDGVLYLACGRKLVMLRDADGNGRADEIKTIHEWSGTDADAGCGFGGLALGPDGRVYGTMGDGGMVASATSPSGRDPLEWGVAFRFELDGSRFEVFHRGLRSPGEIAFDLEGRAFTLDGNPGSGGTSRVVRLIDGGDSGWAPEHEILMIHPERAGLKKSPPDRWAIEILGEKSGTETAAFFVPPIGEVEASSRALAYHPGAGFPEKLAQRFFLSRQGRNPGVASFALESDSAGMVVRSSGYILTGAAVENLGFTPDGRLWMAESGKKDRILRLDAGDLAWFSKDAAGAAKILREGFHQRGSAELLNLLRHPDFRIRIHAQLALARKADSFDHFREATLSSNDVVRTHGILGLGILVRCGQLPVAFSDFGRIPSENSITGSLKDLTTLTTDKDAWIRCMSLRALADASVDARDLNLGHLLEDPSPEVRLCAAMVVAKRKLIGYFGPICDLLDQNGKEDPWLRHAGAFALHQMAPDSNMLQTLTGADSSVARLAAVIGLRRMQNSDVVDFLEDSDPLVVNEVLRTICDLDLEDARPAVAELLDALEVRVFSPFMMRRMIHNSYRIGDAQNASRVWKVALDGTQAADLREEAFRLLEIWCKPASYDSFTGRWMPMDARDPEVIAPMLRKSLGGIPPKDGLGIAAAHRLSKIYQLDSSTIPVALVATASTTAAGTNDAPFEAPHSMGNPWLYIIIGMLLVTGILLYVDPRIF